MTKIYIGSTLRLQWGDFISSTVKISATRGGGQSEIVNALAPNQSVDEGYYDYIVVGPETESFIITIADNDNPDITLQFDAVSIVFYPNPTDSIYMSHSVRDMKYNIPTKRLDTKYGGSKGNIVDNTAGINLAHYLNQMNLTEKKATSICARFSRGRLFGRS